MKERGIIYSGWAIPKLLDDSKTQTRRVLKIPKGWGFDGLLNGYGEPVAFQRQSDGLFRFKIIPCPYGRVGDRLWVRETWGVGTRPHPHEGWVDGLEYRADEGMSDPDDPLPLYQVKTPPGVELCNYEPRWRPSIHMPRWASRILMEITDPRVERLQDISEEDARAEGLSMLTKDNGRTWKYGLADRDGLPGNDDYGWHWTEWDADPRVAFARLWDSIHGEGAWELNPWVWCMTFKRIDNNQQQEETHAP